MSSDAPKPPFDAPPGSTPELLQKDVSLDRRRRIPTFEELQHPELLTDPETPAVERKPVPLGYIPPGTVPARPGNVDLMSKGERTEEIPKTVLSPQRAVTVQPAPESDEWKTQNLSTQPLPPDYDFPTELVRPAVHLPPLPPRGSAGPQRAPQPQPPAAVAPQVAAPRAEVPKSSPSGLNAPPAATTQVPAKLVAQPRPAHGPPPAAARTAAPTRTAPPSPNEFARARPAAPAAAPGPAVPQVTAQPVQQGGALHPDHATILNRNPPSAQPTKTSSPADDPHYRTTPLAQRPGAPAPAAPAREPVARAAVAPAPAPVAPVAREPVAPAPPKEPVAPVLTAHAPMKMTDSLPPEMLVTQPGLPGPFARARALPQQQAVPERPNSVPEMEAATAPQRRIPGAPPAAEAPVASAAPVAAPVPAAAARVEAGTVSAEPAALWRRLGAWITDLLFVSVLVLGLLTVAMAVIAPKNLSAVQQLMSIALPGVALGGLLAFVYTALFAFLWSGRTPGRRLMGIHLVDTTGHAPAPIRALIRAALSLVSFGLCLSGFWLALFDRHGQTLHDKLTRTFVVKLQDT